MAKNNQKKKKERERRVAEKKRAAAAKRRALEKTTKETQKTFREKSNLTTPTSLKTDHVPTNKKSPFTQRRSGG